MATLINALNCNKIQLGTGLVPCEIRFLQPKTILRVDPSWTFDPATETFNLAYVIEQIQEGKFTPFLNTLEFLNNTPDPTTKEYQGGATAVIRNGKPLYSMEFDNGIGFHKAAYSYNGFRNSSVILIDKAGNVGLLSNVAGTELKGFLTNMFNTRTYVPEVGDETAKTLIEFQIDNEEAFNRRFTVITAEEIGADLNEEILGVVSVVITGVAYDNNTIDLNVNGLNNSVFGIEGFTSTNFKIVDATTDEVIDINSVTPGSKPGNYTVETSGLTPLTFGQSLIISTQGDGTDTAKVGTNQLYKGESGIILVAQATT